MYLTLTAAFRAATTLACDVLVVSDFGCNNMGHPAQEVASMIYKVAYEFCNPFKAIIVAIPPTNKISDARTNYEEFHRVFYKPKSWLMYFAIRVSSQ